MKNLLQKIIRNKNLPFLLFGIIILIAHFKMQPSNDDLFFKVQLTNMNLFQYIKMRYELWSSRIVIEIFFVFFNQLPILIWRILDTIIFTSIAILLSKLFNQKEDIRFNYIIVLLLLLYPIGDLSSAGWITTTIAYLWPTGAMLYSFYMMKQILNQKKISIFAQIIGFFCNLVAISMEQSCLLMLGFSSLAFLKIVKEKQLKSKENTYIYITLGMSILYLIFIATCPGNAIRFDNEITTWYPAYKNFNVFQKLYLGIVPTMAIFLNNKIVIITFAVLLCMATFQATKKDLFRVLSIFILGFFLLFGVFKECLNILFAGRLVPFLDILFRQDTITSFGIKELLPIGIIICITVIICILLWVIFSKRIFPIMLLLAGIASRMVMGFSPTIFASNNRTAFFLYLSLIILSFLLYQFLTHSKEKTKLNILDGSLLVLVFFNLLALLY